MAKPEPILKIEPENELRFKGPFKEPSVNTMKLTNRTDRRVCFKVKTTAPRRYCVKPTTGVIEPKGSINVLVSLQPFDPNDPNEKGKHKFQVLALYAPDTEFNVENVWKEPGNQDAISDWKLKCVLELTEDSGSTITSTPQSITLKTEPGSGSTVVSGLKDQPVKEEEEGPSYEKARGLETEVKKLSEEIQRLREENSGLLKESLQLKEEGIRLRRAVDVKTTKQPDQVYPGSSASTSTVETGIPPAYLILIIVAAILGALVSKILF